MEVSGLANTPQPPYYAVTFTSIRTDGDNGYAEMAERMASLSSDSPGFLGMEHAASDGLSITICYWESLEAIAAWRQHEEHLLAQQKGYEQWYDSFATRVCRVERDNVFSRPK